jgi:predicted RNA-binding Zn ribbon-like protein
MADQHADHVHRFNLLGGHLALDFVNTVDNRGSEHQQELIPDYPSLLAFVEQAGAITPEELRTVHRYFSYMSDHVGPILLETQCLREALFNALAAHIEGKTAARQDLAFISKCWRESAEQRILVPGPEHSYEWGWLAIERDRGSHLYPNRFLTEHEAIKVPLWRVAAAAGEFMTSKEMMAKVRICASKTCNWLFLDTTKSHTRRWCEMRVCGNRDKARRFYQRRKAQ